MLDHQGVGIGDDRHTVDEMVQIYAGDGFVEEYPPSVPTAMRALIESLRERMRSIASSSRSSAEARDEWTAAADACHQEADGRSVVGPTMSEDDDEPMAEERKIVANAKKLGLFVSGAATQKYMQAIQDQQEVMGAIADMTIEIYAMESATLRTQKLVEAKGEKGAALAVAMTRVYLTQAMDKIESAAKKVIAAVAEGDMLRTQLAILRRVAKYEPFNTIELRQQIAQKMIEAGKYTVA